MKVKSFPDQKPRAGAVGRDKAICKRLNWDPHYKRDSSSHFCHTVTASTSYQDMVSKWEVNVVESVFQEIKQNVS